jgi:hypothetical protein
LETLLWFHALTSQIVLPAHVDNARNVNQLDPLLPLLSTLRLLFLNNVNAVSAHPKKNANV